MENKCPRIEWRDNLNVFNSNNIYQITSPDEVEIVFYNLMEGNKNTTLLRRIWLMQNQLVQEIISFTSFSYFYKLLDYLEIPLEYYLAYYSYDKIHNATFMKYSYRGLYYLLGMEEEITHELR